MKRLAPVIAPLLAIVLVLAPATRAAAPDERAPFRTTAHFRFFGDEDVEGTLTRLADSAEERLQRLCAPIAACDRLTRPIDVWVAADAERFAASFPDDNPMSEWASGVTFLRAQRIVLRRHGTAVFTLQETFDHEVAHVLAHTFAHGGGARALPRWFSEGLAIWQAGEALAGRLNEALRAAAMGQLLTFDELDRRFPNEGVRVGIAYAQSALFVRKLARTAGPQAIVSLLHDVGQGVPFDTSFRTHFGAEPAALFERAAEDIESSSSPFSLFADGNLIWGLVTVLFLFAAWWRLRERKHQMARMSDSEDERIAAEELEVLAERERLRPRPDHDLMN